ncbi:MAG: hypothetical protein ACI9Y1_001881 [Lentisphaeria bacterium]|jgi:hypothetical protein
MPMKCNTRLIFNFLFPALLLGSALARAGSQDAHTHGLATLTLALENEMLEIRFESPAANLVGFEHAARSAKEKEAAAHLETVLKEPVRLFAFIGTHCQLIKTAVDVSGVAVDEHNKTKEHDHHSHSKEHEESDHSEISAEYLFSCKNLKQLDSVSVDLMNQFAGIEKIDVMWITETKQGAVALTPNNNVIAL